MYGQLIHFGIPVMDQEHERILKKGHELLQILKTGGSDEGLVHEMEAFESLVEEHFRHEELLLIRYEYPDYKAHCASHEKLMHKLQNFKHLIAMSDVTDHQLRRMEGVFSSWMDHHIFDEDNKVAKWVKAHSAIE